MIYHRFLASIFLLIGSIHIGFSLSYTVPYPISGGTYNGETRGVQPGDTIYLDANIAYGNFVFHKIRGTAEKPIVIMNKNGQAVINSTHSFGLKFTESSHFKLIGKGDRRYKYGIKISTTNGFYLIMQTFTTDFEIANIEIAGNPANPAESGFAGIAAKTSPYEDCELFKDKTRQAWIMRNVLIHYNYIHDTGGEGMYIGHGFYAGRKESDCTDTTYSHSIKTLRIYGNIIENTGYDGMQIKNADDDVRIYRNVIRNFGKLNEGAHNEGLFLGEGVTGNAYNNWIENGTGNGIQFQGLGGNKIFNNVIIGCHGYGFYAAGGPYVVRDPAKRFSIYNNTIAGCGKGMVFYGAGGGRKELINNLFIKIASGKYAEKGVEDVNEKNLGFPFYSYAKIKDSITYDLGLLSTSPARNAGADLSLYSLPLGYDYNYDKRPYDGLYDVGAFEYTGLSTARWSDEEEQDRMYSFPNPANMKGSFSISVTSPASDVATLSLIDHSGKEFIHIENVSLTEGINITEINLSECGSLTPGVYFIKVKSAAINITEKIIIR